MKFVMNLESIKDKTVKSAALVDGAESLVVLFTDDTCVFIDVKFFGSSYELELINNPDTHIQHEAGIITTEKYQVMKEEDKRANAEKRKQRELEELERLTKKYKGGDSIC
jgi:hypothetical protein